MTPSNPKDLQWSLFNSKAQTRIDGLSSKQVVSLLVCFAQGDLDQWLLWQEGMTDWEPAGAFYHSLAAKQGKRRTHVENHLGAGAAAEIIHEPHREARTSSIELRRRPRYRVVMRAIVNGGGYTVRSEIENLSLGGLKLKAHLPPEMNGSVLVTLINKGAELVLKCRVLRSENEKLPTRLKIESCSRMDILSQWILSDAA